MKKRAKERKLVPLSPLQGQKQLAAVRRLFETLPPEQYTVRMKNAAEKRIIRAMELWGKK